MMTLLRDRNTVEMHPIFDQVRTTTEWLYGVIGALLASIGASLYYTADETVTATATNWQLSMMILGGLVMTTAFGVATRKIFTDEGLMTGKAYGHAFLALAGLAIAITFAVIWIV